jgi:hypothetical protein
MPNSFDSPALTWRVVLPASTSFWPASITVGVVAQKTHQRAADGIRLLLLQPMTSAVKQSVFLHLRASARSHDVDGPRSHMHCPIAFASDETRWHIYSAVGEELKLGNQ